MNVQEFQFSAQIEKLTRLLSAFSVRDIQVANTLVDWLGQNGVTSAEFQNYVRGWVEINRLQALGYFGATDTPERSKHVRELEKSISDKDLRRYIRKMRLNTTQFKVPGQRGG